MPFLPLLALGGLAAFAYTRLKGGSSASNRIVNAAKRLVPCDYDTSLWDTILGGRISPGVWRYYEVNHGTTCGIVTGAILEQAGANPLLINRGASYRIGAHISRLYEGGKKLGILRTDPDLQPGNVYCVTQDSTKPGDHSHVGVVLARQGETLITADGGQTDSAGHQCARIVRRRLVGKRIIGPQSAGTFAWRLVL